MRIEAGLRGVALVVVGMACTAAVAGPPFLTDDPDPVDLHHAEINLIQQQTRAATGRAGSVSGEVNVGCAAETQCHLAVPVAFDCPGGKPSAAGFNIGAIASVWPHQNLLISAGRGLTHVETNRCSVFLAYQLEL